MFIAGTENGDTRPRNDISSWRLSRIPPLHDDARNESSIGLWRIKRVAVPEVERVWMNIGTQLSPRGLLRVRHEIASGAPQEARINGKGTSNQDDADRHPYQKPFWPPPWLAIVFGFGGFIAGFIVMAATGRAWGGIFGVVSMLAALSLPILKAVGWL